MTGDKDVLLRDLPNLLDRLAWAVAMGQRSLAGAAAQLVERYGEAGEWLTVAQAREMLATYPHPRGPTRHTTQY